MGGLKVGVSERTSFTASSSTGGGGGALLLWLATDFLCFLEAEAELPLFLVLTQQPIRSSGLPAEQRTRQRTGEKDGQLRAARGGDSVG